MRRDNRFDDTDKAALHKALLATNVCPDCRGALVAFVCQDCKRQWKRLFIVRCEMESIVLADDESDACKVAARFHDDIASEVGINESHLWDATELDHVLAGWSEEPGALVWATEGDHSLSELLTVCAPYQETKARVTAQQAQHAEPQKDKDHDEAV